MKYFKYIFFLLLILSNARLSAQEYSYKHYTIQDGLVQTQVWTIFQDSKGYIWAGTKGGVSRFDGISFLNFTHNDGLPNSVIISITEDSRGTIWFLTPECLSSYDGNKITAYPTTHLRYYKSIFAFYENSPGKMMIVYVNAQNQVIFTQFSNNKYTDIISLFPASKLEYPLMLNFDGFYDPKDKTFWLAAQPYGLFRIRGEKSEKINFNINTLRALSLGPDKHVYLMTNDSAFRVENNSLKYLYSYKPVDEKKRLHRIVIDHQGTIYFDNNEHRLLVFSIKKDAVTEHFDFNEINSLYTDREDNLWVGSELGLYRLQTRAFVNFIPDKCGIGDLIWSISEDRNKKIWFASYNGGLQYYDGLKFVNGAGYQKFTDHRDVKYYMGSIIDHEHNILFPLCNLGGLKFNGSIFTKIFPDSLIATTLFFFENPGNFDLYAGTNNGLFRFSKKYGIENLDLQPGNGKSRNVVSIVKDKLNRYWFGGFNGISLINGNQKIHLPTKEIPFDKGGNAMLIDKFENIWIGNADGLFVYNYREFKQIKHPDIHSLITSLALSGDSALLIGTVTGFAMLNLNSYYSRNKINLRIFDKENGFQGLEVGQNAIFKDSKGYYWIATSDRVIRFDPTEYRSNLMPPLTYISNVSFLNNKMEWVRFEDTFVNSGHFHFSHNQKNLKFEFIGISTTDPERVMYSHFMKGYDHGWSEPGYERYAVYTNLPPGEYNLLLKSCNGEGVWTKEAVSMHFRIIPAIYQRTTFWLVCFLLMSGLFILLGFVISNQRKRQHQFQLENDKKMAQLKLLSVKNQMDPHFTINAINSIASIVLKGERERAYAYFVKLSQMIRMIIGSSDKLTCTLKDELGLVKGYLDINKFRFSDKFDYQIIISPGLDLNRYIPKMSIQTFTENAVKHGLLMMKGKGMLKISLTETNEDLKIEVEDNGIGREKAQQNLSISTGKGLLILQDYYDYFNRYSQVKISWEINDLHNDSGIACGTRAVVNIPGGFSASE